MGRLTGFVTLLLLCLSLPAFAQDVHEGDSRDQVITTLGEPQGSARMGDYEILTYDSLKVVFQGGQVVEITPISKKPARVRPGPPPAPKPAPKSSKSQLDQPKSVFSSSLETPDLDVTFIERLPRYPSLHGKVSYVDMRHEPSISPEGAAITRFAPEEGERVEFVAHVTNKGRSIDQEVDTLWRIDGQEVQTGRLKVPRTGEEASTSLAWTWQKGAHSVTFEVDPRGSFQDAFSQNNKKTDSVDGLGFTFFCTREAYDQWNSKLNMAGTLSFEDWMNWHFDEMNRMFREAVYPSTPQGCLERVRVDYFSVVEEGENLAQRVKDLNPAGAWTFQGNDLGPDKPDYGLIHEMGHQVGLIDEYNIGFNFMCNRVEDQFGLPCMEGYVFYDTGSNMYGCGPRYSEFCAGGLNRMKGYPRGYFGTYLFDHPDRYVLRVLDRTGKPLRNARVTYYREFGVSFVACQEGETDSQGLMELKNEGTETRPIDRSPFAVKPTPFGKIDILGRNAILCFHIQANGQEGFIMTEMACFILRYWRSNRARSVVVDLKTRIGPEWLPPPPSRVKAEWGTESNVRLSWQPPQTVTPVTYNVYASILPDPYSAVLPPPQCVVKGLKDPQYSGPALSGFGMRFSVTATDVLGQEGGFSHDAWVPPPAQPSDRVHLLYEASRARLLLSYGSRVYSQYDTGMFIPRTIWFEGAGGMALDRHDNLLVAAARDSNSGGHCAMLFSMKIAPRGPLLTYEAPLSQPDLKLEKPVDVAVDGQGCVVVADETGGRVPVFSRSGELIADLGARGDEDSKIQAPLSVAILPSGHILVGDQKLGRLVACKIEPGRVKYTTLKGAYPEPTDLVVTSGGNVLVVDRELGAVLLLSPPGYETQKILARELTSPWSVALHKKGRLIVYDAGRKGMEAFVSLPDALDKETTYYLESLGEEECQAYSVLPPEWRTKHASSIDVRDWCYAGPFGNEEGAGFDTVYGPETEDRVDPKMQFDGVLGPVSWQALPVYACVDGHLVRFDHIVTPSEGICVYASAWLDSPSERVVRMLTGSDDGMAVWVNGHKVLSRDELRMATPGNESTEVTLNPGKNRILVKVCNQLNLCGFYLRWVDPQTSQFPPDLKYVRLRPTP